MHPNLRFCDGDLEKLKQRKLRDILCENSDVPYLAQSVFRVPKEGSNPVINCTTVNPLNAEDLCLFGSNRPAKDLEPPGFKTSSREGTYGAFTLFTDFDINWMINAFVLKMMAN